jgi:tetratricopeptide (TPR) repeat protein
MLRRLDEDRIRVQYWAERFGINTRDDPFLVPLAHALAGASVGRPFDEVLRLLPQQRSALAADLANVLAVEWLTRNMPDQPASIISALGKAGAYLELLRRFPGNARARAQALYNLGRYDEVLQSHRQMRYEAGMSLARLGRYEEALREYPDQPAACAAALFRLGRYRACAEAYPYDSAYAFRSAWLSGTMPAFLRAVQANPDMQIVLYQTSLRWPAEEVREFESRGMALTVNGNYNYPGAFTYLGRPEEAARHTISPDALAYTLLVRGLTDSVLSLAGNNLVVLRLARLERGDYAEVTQEGVMIDANVEALLRGGRVDEFLARFPLRRTAGANMLLWAGRYDEVTKRFADQRQQCAQALVALGRYDVVQRDYADCWRQCNDALLGEGRFEESRTRFPEFREEYTQALLAAGRYREVADSSEDQPLQRGIARVRLGRYSDALAPSCVRPLLLEESQIICHQALTHWINGERAKADAAFGTPRVFYFDQAWWHLRFEQFLLQPVLHALAGDRAALDSACVRIMRDHPTHFGRQLWHEAAWLSGAITDEQFLKQPHGRGVQDRLAFLKAVKADVEGRTQEARTGYEACRALPRYPRPLVPWDIFESWTVRGFVEWRATQLRP